MGQKLEIKRLEELVKGKGIQYSLEILELLFLNYQILEKSKKESYPRINEFLKTEEEIDAVLLKIKTLFEILRGLQME